MDRLNAENAMHTSNSSKAPAASAWLSPETADLPGFARSIARCTALADWPLAVSVEKNIVVYAGDSVRKAALDPKTSRAMMAEWAGALSHGPGVIVIRAALSQASVIDRATEIFEAVIAGQKHSNSGGGDHFAKPGANERIWNSLQKHCMADPANFAAYYAAPAIAMVSMAWLGPDYQMSAQVNRVNPGGAAQSGHRDYHLGFMTPAQAQAFPEPVHRLSPLLTLQGAIAHCDMPLESGPTLLLPYSQNFLHGYLVFGEPQYQEFFAGHHVQLPLEKGDAMFFNPALMHAAGNNRSAGIFRMANLLQVSSAFGRAMESIDRIAMAKSLYPALLAAGLNASLDCAGIANAIAACAEGYAFPTNLDHNPPLGGLAPMSQAALMAQAIADKMPPEAFARALDTMAQKRLA